MLSIGILYLDLGFACELHINKIPQWKSFRLKNVLCGFDCEIGANTEKSAC